MSDERKDQRSLDSDFPGEEQLSRLYREGSEELPPANLDAVVLDAAVKPQASDFGSLYLNDLERHPERRRQGKRDNPLPRRE